jgi:hypothetical protein
MRMGRGRVGEGGVQRGGDAVALHEALAKALELSSCAAACVGPKMRRPRARNRSTTPAASGASGPTTVSATFSALAKSASCAGSVSGRFFSRGSAGGAAVAGGHEDGLHLSLCASFQASACSRPPPPMTRTFMRTPGSPSQAL